jgi:hypothetical protein
MKSRVQGIPVVDDSVCREMHDTVSSCLLEYSLPGRIRPGYCLGSGTMVRSDIADLPSSRKGQQIPGPAAVRVCKRGFTVARIGYRCRRQTAGDAVADASGETLGQFLKRLRMRAGLTQEELAEAAGLAAERSRPARDGGSAGVMILKLDVQPWFWHSTGAVMTRRSP